MSSGIPLSKIFKTFIWPRKYVLLLGLLLIIINRAFSLVLPWTSKSFLDDVVQKKDLELLKVLVIIIVAATLFQTVTSYLLTRLLTIEAQRLISILRARVQRHILSLPTVFFDNHKAGALVSRVMHDVEGVRYLVGRGLIQLIGGIFTALFSLVMMIRISPMMTLCVVIPVSLLALVYQKAFSYIRPVFRERGAIRAEITGRLTETLNGIRIIKGFNGEKQEIQNFENGVEKLFENVKKGLTYSSLVNTSGNLMLGLISAAIMGISGYLIVGKGTLTPGDFLSFTLFLGFMVAPILDLSDIGTQLSEAFAGLDRTEEIMKVPSEDNPTVRTNNLQEIRGDIQFHNVSFAYEKDKEVLRNISFKAEVGTVTALVGSSGSGKSTIASLSASFLNPTSGTITIDGHDLSEVTLSAYRRHLGVVLQDDFLFEGTIRENIIFARPSATHDELQHALTVAHIHQITNKLEKGLDTIVGERGVKLSGGQRQRIAIARAVLANPKILILDEATSSLDAESERYIKDSLDKLLKGRTTLVIAHRLSTIRQANQILVIENGQIAERGTHDELLYQKGRYHELYTYQIRI